MDKKHVTIPISYDLNSVTNINPIISRYTVRVMYPGGNRNGSYFSKDTIEKMVQTLGGIPVIGQYSEKDEDFMAHGDLVFRTNSDGSSEIVTEGTEPYGFVNLKPNYWWSNHEDKDGVTREYLNVEVFLWTGRFKELERINEGKNGHSMEIEASGSWGEIDGEEYFICDENSYFTGLCILGEEVEPCFEGAAIVPQFSLIKEERMAELNEALTKFNLQAQESKESEQPEVKLEEFNLENYVKVEEYNSLEEKYTESLNNFTDIQERYNTLLANKAGLEEEIASLKETNSQLEEANKKYAKEIEKTEKMEVVNTYANRISKENYDLLVTELDNLSKKDLKIKALEFSVDYLTKNSLFNNKQDMLTLNPEDNSNIALYNEESWQAQVLAKQQEEKR